jgi:LacI family transcriptional regulator
MILAGGDMYNDQPTPANIVYDLAQAAHIDGLVIVAGTMFKSTELAQAFCQQYAPRPIVSIAQPLASIPSLISDGYQGQYAVVKHLIEEHQCRRIACFRRPEGHSDLDIRYQAYVDALETYGLDFDPNLVVSGPFGSPNTVYQAIHTLLDERQLRPGIEFDALVAFDDKAGYYALDALQQRGIQVPDDVALTGSGDRMGRFATPPITAAAQSVVGLGEQAVY